MFSVISWGMVSGLYNLKGAPVAEILRMWQSTPYAVELIVPA